MSEATIAYPACDNCVVFHVEDGVTCEDGCRVILCPAHAFAEADAKRLAEVVEQCIEAFRLTREYLGEDVLPNIEGWAHYDAVVAAREALAGD